MVILLCTISAKFVHCFVLYFQHFIGIVKFPKVAMKMSANFQMECLLLFVVCMVLKKKSIYIFVSSKYL